MKKLLSILGALTITASSAALVVACGDKEKEKKNSTFIDADGELKIDSEKVIDWVNQHGGSFEDPQKYIGGIYDLFAVAIFDSAAKGKLVLEGTPEAETAQNDTDTLVIKKDSNYYNENLIEELKGGLGEKTSTDLKTLWGRANEAYILMKKSHDDDKDKIKDYLTKEFPNVKKSKLENAYKTRFVLEDKKYGASPRLKQILGFSSSIADSNWESGITSQQSSDSNNKNLLNALRNNFGESKLSSLSNDIHKAITEGNTGAIEAIGNLVNATGGLTVLNIPAADLPNQKISINKLEFVKKDTITQLSVDNIKTLLSRIEIAELNGVDGEKLLKDTNYFSGIDLPPLPNGFTFFGTNGHSAINYFDLVSEYPKITNGLELKNDNGVYGFLKNSQRNLVNTYYANKKPVAISEVLIPFNGSVTDNSTLSLKNFISDTVDNQKLIEQFAGFENFYTNYVNPSKTTKATGIADLSAYGMTNWDTIMRGDDQGIKDENTLVKPIEGVWGTDYYKAKANEKLLTLDSASADYSNEYKYSIYDFLVNSGETVPLTIDEVTDESLITLNIENETLRGKIKDALTKVNGEDSKITKRREQATKGLGLMMNLINKINQGATRTVVEPTSNVKSSKPLSYAKVVNKAEAAASDKKMYTVLNADEGIIAFMDATGLHISRIDGYKLLKSDDIHTETKRVEFKGNEENYLNESRTFQILNSIKLKDKSNDAIPYLINKLSLGNSSTTPTPAITPRTTRKIDEKDIDNFGLNDLSPMNQAISNKYERFLVNSSIAKNLVSTDGVASFYGFDILEDVSKNINSSEENKLAENGSWLWDYFADLTNSENKDMLTKLMQFGDDANSEKVKTKLSKGLDASSSNSSFIPYLSFGSSWETWNKTVKEKYQASINEGSHSYKPNTSIDYSEEAVEQIFNLKAFEPTKQTEISQTSTRNKNVVLQSIQKKQVIESYTIMYSDNVISNFVRKEGK